MTPDELKAELAARAPDVCWYLFPGGRINGDEFEIGDLAGNAGESLKINLNGKAGVWSDFATGAKGSNLLELWMQVRGLPFVEAMREAGEWLGHAPNRNGKPHSGGEFDGPIRAERLRQTRERSKNYRSDTLPAHIRVPNHTRLGGAVAVYLYTDPNGHPAFVVCRFEPKDFRPYDIAVGKWQEPKTTPLYRVNELDAAVIILVGGEKCANALRELGFSATTVMGGEGKVNKSDLEPLRGLVVYAWRDADSSGEKWIEALRAASVRFGFELRVVPLPEGASEGQDVADLIDLEGWTAEDIKAQLDMAEPVTDAETDTGTGSMFVIITDADLEKLPAIEWGVENLILQESVVQMIGHPGSMKSFLAFDIMAHRHLGLTWAGRAVKQTTGLYVLGEGARCFGLRVRAWRIHRGYEQPLGVNFLTMPVQIADKEEVDEFLRAVDGLGVRPGFVVLDTQARCSVGLDEKDNTQMGEIIAGAERIQRAIGGCVMLLHHPARGTERERGGNAQRGGVDTSLYVSADGSQLSVRVDRQKDGEDGTVLNFQRRIIQVDDTRTSCVLVPMSPQEVERAPSGPGEIPASVRKILDVLRTTDSGLTAAMLTKVTLLPERTVFDALKKARGWNFVDGTKSYRITPVGRGLFV